MPFSDFFRPLVFSVFLGIIWTTFRYKLVTLGGISNAKMAQASCPYGVPGSTHRTFNHIHSVLRIGADRWYDICAERRAVSTAVSTAAGTTSEHVSLPHDSTSCPDATHLAMTEHGEQTDYEFNAEEPLFSIDSSDVLGWPYEDNFDGNAGLPLRSQGNSAAGSRSGSQSPAHIMLPQHVRSEDNESDDDQTFDKTWREMFLTPSPVEQTVQVPKTPEQTITEVPITPSTMPRSSAHNNSVRTYDVPTHFTSNNSLARFESNQCAARGNNSRFHPYAQYPPAVRRNRRHGGFV